MRKTVILAMFVCVFSAAYSQDLIEKIQSLTLENDSLRKENKRLQTNSDEQLEFYNDSISRLIATHKSEVTDLNKKISTAEKDLDKANKKVAALDKNVVKAERDSLQKQVDALIADTTALHKKLSEKDGQLAAAKTECDEKAREAKEQGRNEALVNVLGTYEKPFDELIEFSTKQSVERDSSLVGYDEATRKKLQDLQTYFTAQQVLSEQYSEQKVHTAQSQISALEQTELVKELTVKLGKYKLCNDGLKSAIDEVLKIDREFTANNEKTQKTKMQDISYVISRYFYDYPSFGFSAYPYLTHIIWEIYTRKQKDANTDISDLLEKL